MGARPSSWIFAAAALLLTGCGHPWSAPDRPSTAEARAYHYQDSSGLLVGSYGAAVRQRLPVRATVEAKALADYVKLDRNRGFDPSNPAADRRAPDAVTSASATVGRGAVATEWRFEGQLGVDLERELGALPATFGLVARASSEPDYTAVSIVARGTVELFERNTLLTWSAGHGRDRVEPVEVFGGQEALWPATHRRWTATLGVTQLLAQRLVLSGGAAATWQRGTLSSPYRRALIVPNLLLPEDLPDRRDRYTGFVALALSLTPELALHLKQGGYLDSWSVRALIPEVILAAQIDAAVLLQVSYRYYRQRRAEFYQATYDMPRAIMTGDLRLGALSDHTLGFDLRRQLRPGRRVPLPLLAGYQISVLDYRGVGSRVVAHVFSLGLEASY